MRTRNALRHTPDSLVLQRSAKEIRQFRWMWILPLIFVFALLITDFFLEIPNELPENGSDLWESLKALLMRPNLMVSLLTTLIFIPLSLYTYLAVSRGRVVVNPTGIGFQSNLPGFFQGWLPHFSPKDWFAQWDAVSTLQLKQSDQSKLQPGPRFIALKVHTKPQPPELFPYQWVNPNDNSFQPRLSQGLQWKTPDSDAVAKEVLLSPLMKYIATHKIPSQHKIHLLVDFDLGKSWANIRIVLVLLVVLPLLLLIPLIGALTEWSFFDARPAQMVEADAATKARYALHDSLKYELTGHTDNVLPVAFSPDGAWLASGSKDRRVRLWKVADGTSQHVLKGHRDRVQALAFSPDGAWLASGGDDNTIRIWRTADGEAVKTLKIPAKLGHEGVYGLAVNPAGTLLASGNWDSSITLWQFPDGEQLYHVPGETKGVLGFGKSNGPGHYDSVNSVAFSPDGSLLASGSFDDTAKVWQVADDGGLQLRHTLKAKDWITVLCFSPDGSLLAAGGFDKRIEIWQVADGRHLRTIAGHQQTVAGLAFHPDGNILASGSYDRTVKLWETHSGQLLANLSGHRDYVNSVAFSADGTLLASGSGDDTVRVWWSE